VKNRKMDLQTRKLNVIKYLISLKDEKIFSKIESAVAESQNPKVIKNNFKPFTQRQLLARAKQSNKDYQDGKFKTVQQLEKESEKW
jgi:hypothetical protein